MASTALAERSAGVRRTRILLDLAGPDLEARGGATGGGGTTRTQVVQGVHQTAGTSITTHRLNVQHFAPDITRSSFAEIDFDLNRGFQCLNIMEDHGERDQATGHGDRTEHDGGEGDRTGRRCLVTHAG
jgi:hypothetical protein